MHFGMLSIFQNYRGEQNDADIVQGELALARLADETGFDSYWAVEHHFFDYSMCPDNLQYLAQVAALTERVRLGTGAVIMPWNDPYRVAAKMALLDQQSGGRALLGFGRGLSKREYAGFNMPMDEARGRFDQGTELVLRGAQQGLLRGGYRVLLAAEDRAATRGRPADSKIGSTRSASRPTRRVQAAVLGAQLMVLAQQPWEVFRQQALEPYQERWASLRDTPAAAAPLRPADVLRRRRRPRPGARDEVREGVLLHGRRALRDRRASISRTRRATSITATRPRRSTPWVSTTMAEMYASVNLYGTPDEIVEQLRSQKQILGVDHDVLVMPKYGSMTQAEAENSTSLFARDVIPRF